MIILFVRCNARQITELEEMVYRDLYGHFRTVISHDDRCCHIAAIAVIVLSDELSFKRMVLNKSCGRDIVMDVLINKLAAVTLGCVLKAPTENPQ